MCIWILKYIYINIYEIIFQCVTRGGLKIGRAMGTPRPHVNLAPSLHPSAVEHRKSLAFNKFNRLLLVSPVVSKNETRSLSFSISLCPKGMLEWPTQLAAPTTAATRLHWSPNNMQPANPANHHPRNSSSQANEQTPSSLVSSCDASWRSRKKWTQEWNVGFVCYGCKVWKISSFSPLSSFMCLAFSLSCVISCCLALEQFISTSGFQEGTQDICNYIYKRQRCLSCLSWHSMSTVFLPLVLFSLSLPFFNWYLFYDCSLLWCVP